MSLERFKQISEVVMIWAAIALLGAGTYYVLKIGPKVEWSISRATYTIEDINGLVNPARHAVAKLSASADENAAFLHEEEAVTLKLSNAGLGFLNNANWQATKVGALVDDINANINHNVLPAATDALKSLGGMADAGREAIQAFNIKWLSNEQLRASMMSTAANVQDITASGKGIGSNAKRISDSLTQKYYAPQPWYKKYLLQPLKVTYTGAKLFLLF